MNTQEQEALVVEICRNARLASQALAKTSAQDRRNALVQIAKAIQAQATEILAANKRDVEGAVELDAAMLDRLTLNPQRIEKMAMAVHEIADMEDLIGAVVSTNIRPNGLEVSRVRIPLGVIGMIFESRPNVTSDAAALCLRAGNAVILRGGKEAIHSNTAIAKAIHAGLESADFPLTAVQVFATTDRSAMLSLLQQDELVDLIIPRGGEGLIRFVSEHSRIPVIKHYKGVCHVYVHEGADLAMACSIAVNAKASRPGVCNAAETILVDQAIAEKAVPMLVEALVKAGVEVRGCSKTQALSTQVVAASESDWNEEFLAKIVAFRVVEGFDEAVSHIQRYGSDHTEAIITTNSDVSRRFTTVVHSSTVVVNASTRFADGGQLGLGAEIGISTTKLHAFGPMGAEGLTTTKFVVQGQGQIRD